MASSDDQAMAMNLIRYIYGGRNEKIRRCIQYGSYDINQKVKLNIRYHRNQYTYPILTAVKKSNYQIAKILIESSTLNINAQTHNELNTALHIAAKRGSVEIAKLMLDSGININVQRLDMKTALHLVVLYCDYTMATFLIDNGADINKPDDKGMSPLCTACSKGDLEMIKLLCTNYANIYQADNNGRMAIFHACMAWYGIDYVFVKNNNRIDTVRFLLDQTPDHNIDLSDSNGQSVLFYACGSGRLDIVKLLIDRGANINHLDNKGQTVLFKMGHLGSDYQIMVYLLECGADYTILDKSGQTAIESLTGRYHVIFARAIEEHIKKMELETPTKGVNE